MSKPKAKKNQDTGKRTLFVKFQNQDQKKVTIPDGCKVTFGPLCPGSKHDNGAGATALRVYNGPTTNATQIACFVRVESFYETDTVACISRSTKRAQKVQQYNEGGVEKQRAVAVEVSEWRDELAEEDASTNDGSVFLALKAEHADKF